MPTFSRNCSPELQAEFDNPNPRIAYLMALVIPNNPDEGYTSFDRDLPFGAILDEDGNELVPALNYKCQGGVLPTQITSQTGGSDDMVDVTAGLDMASRIKWENEYYIGSEVTLMACAWDNPGAGTMILFSGKMGQADLGDISARFQFSPWVSLLQRNILRVIGPVCDCPLFAQGRCAGSGQDPSAPQINARTSFGQITGVNDETDFYVSNINKPDGWANFGRLYFTSGQNAGARARIVKSQAGGRVVLHNDFPHALQVGDAFAIEEGCARTWSACQSKDNTNNFQGFPFLPGQQGVVSRYSNN